MSEQEEPFDVFLIWQTGETITARAGYHVLPDYGFHNHEPVDVLIVVGGVHNDEMHKPKVIQWISEQAKKAPLVVSVRSCWLRPKC